MSVNERGYALFHRQNVSYGVSPADFGEWVANNAEIKFVPHIRPELLESGENVQTPSASRVTIFMIYNNRVMDTAQISLRNSGDDQANIQSASSQLSRTVQQLSSRLTQIPGDMFIPGDSFIPGDMFIETARDAERLAVSGAQRAVGSGGGKVSFVFIATPDADRFETPVNPGGAVFVMDSASDD